jgi:hypothetical protein
VKGWKTWTAVGLTGLGGALRALGYADVAEAMWIMAGMFGLTGLGHKIEKTRG